MQSAAFFSAHAWFDSGYIFRAICGFFQRMLGSTVDTYFVQSAAFFQRMLVSTVDAFFVQSAAFFSAHAWFDSGYIFRAICGFFPAHAWLDSGYIFCVSVRTYSAQCLVRLHILRQCAYVFSAMLGSTVDTWFASLWSFFRAPGIWQTLVQCSPRP